MTETLINTTESLQEEVNGKKEWFIEGVFMQSNVKNRNGRIYPKAILEREVDAYNTNFIQTNRAVGELNHPKSFAINPREISHKVLSLQEHGDNFEGKAMIINTPMGNIVKGLLEAKIQIGVSSRGIGSTKDRGNINEVQSDYKFACPDIVSSPSAPDAFVNGIMEGVEYFFEDGILHEREIEEIKKSVHQTSLKDMSENNARIFMTVMNKLL